MRVLTTAEGEVRALAFSPDGHALAAAVEHRGVFLWNLQSTGTPVRLDDRAEDRVGDLHFSPDGRSVGWLAGNRWKVYDRDTRTASRPRLAPGANLSRLVPYPGGSGLVTQSNWPTDPSLTGWRVVGDGWEPEWEVATRELAVYQLTIAPDGRRLAMLTRKTARQQWSEKPPRLEVRSTVSGVITATGSYPYRYDHPLVFSPDGSQLVGVHDMSLLRWAVPPAGGPRRGEAVPDLGDPQLVRNDSRKQFTAAAYHPSGKYLFATNNDATVHVFDTAGWGRQARYGWNLGRLRAVAVAPDGTLAAAGGDRGEVVVWDVDF